MTIDKPIRADMPDAVLDGRLGEVATTRLRYFPTAYAWGALVTAAGAMVQRQEGSLIRPNLYWCAFGPAGSGKTSP